MRAHPADHYARPHPLIRMLPQMFGEWLSLVEHLVRDQGVGGSNPLSPTIFRINRDGYMLNSGRPNRLWFSRFVDIRMEDVCQGHGIDHHSLLSEPVEELAAAI
jgi:hypothetical protein